MKTYTQFRQEMEAAVGNLQEAKGFTPSKKRRKKKTYLSARDEKIQDLKRRSGQDGRKVSWAGLEQWEVRQ